MVTMLNGNGEMTGAHWVDEAGFMSKRPIVLTDTLDIGRADDGVISWMIKQHPEIGIRDDVPLPVVAECDDEALNDIQGRHVSADDVVKLLDAAKPADFARGSVGAGTGMLAFGFKAGIGSASAFCRQLSAATRSACSSTITPGRRRGQVARSTASRSAALSATELLPVFPSRRSALPASGHVTDGSIIIIIATDAPLDATKLRELAKRATLGLARSGSNSQSLERRPVLGVLDDARLSDGDGVIAGPALVADSRRIDALFAAAADATEAAIDDALFSARTMTGRDGITFYGLPYEQVGAASSPMMRVPDEAAQRVSRIEALLDEAERVLAGGNALDEASYSLRETRARYLPDTLRAYLDVPPSLRGERDASGRTPNELLIAQLDHLERATAQRLRELAARRTEGIAANGAFLTERFGPAGALPETAAVAAATSAPLALVRTFLDGIERDAGPQPAPSSRSRRSALRNWFRSCVSTQRGRMGFGAVEALQLTIPMRRPWTALQPQRATRRYRGQRDERRTGRRAAHRNGRSGCRGCAGSTKTSARSSNVTATRATPLPASWSTK